MSTSTYVIKMSYKSGRLHAECSLNGRLVVFFFIRFYFNQITRKSELFWLHPRKKIRYIRILIQNLIWSNCDWWFRFMLITENYCSFYLFQSLINFFSYKEDIQFQRYLIILFRLSLTPKITSCGHYDLPVNLAFSSYFGQTDQDEFSNRESVLILFLQRNQ